MDPVAVSKSPAPRKKAKPRRKTLRGRMEPFSREALSLIRGSLKAQSKVRDLALLSVGVDSMLRCGDLLSLRVRDVRSHDGMIRDRFPVQQEKTGGVVMVTLTPKTQAALADLITAESKWSDDYFFTAANDPHGKAISEVMLRRLVKGWARTAHLDPRQYSGHSLRRTKAVFIYRETHNAEAVRQLLGHGSLAHTIHYLGVKADEVSDLARAFDI